MKNILAFDGGYKAHISYDADIDLFRGEFIGLNGGADFYAKDIEGLKQEGSLSLQNFLRMCAEDGVSPKKTQGKFALRLDPETYHAASLAATAQGQSLNKWIAQVVRSAAMV